MKIKTINRIVFLLSLIGIAMGTYVLQSFLRKTGIVCLTGDGCTLVRQSPVSYPFGIPVPLIGVIGYSCLAILSFLHTLKERAVLRKCMMGVATFGIFFVTWFTSMEVFVIHGICMWCALSAVNMFVIFGLTVASMLQDEQTVDKT